MERIATMDVLPSSVGVMVLAEFVVDGRDWEVIRKINPNYPESVIAKIGPSESRDLYLRYGHFDSLIASYDFHLFSLPEAARRNFFAQDIHLPVEIIGAIATVDFPTLFRSRFYKEEGEKFYKSVRSDWELSGITWIEASRLPFVVAGFVEEEMEITTSQMREILELRSDIAVASFSKSFDKNDVRFLLATLAAQIGKQPH